MVMEDVKETLCPTQTFVLAEAMLIVGVTNELTVTEMLLDVAVVGEAHVALLVSTQVTTLLLFKPADEKLAPVPALLPFTFH